MSIATILAFLSELGANNTREWFAVHKDWYENSKNEFEKIAESLLLEIAKFDNEIKHLQAKDCIFRIYRDTRFSKDKTPYKTHFGVFIAADGGRKSQRAGYYLHLDPAGSFLASGVWCPEPSLLKALRKSVVDNIEELEEILEEALFNKAFSSFFEEDKLKNIPKGFPKDFKNVELLKLKHYLVKHELTDDMMIQSDAVKQIAEICKIAHPFNRFFNYTVDEFK